MNETKYSPGPWHVDAVMSEALHEVCMSNPPPGQGNPVMLASVYHDEQRNECPSLAEANANARLMAAAPDLLAALETLVAMLHPIGDESRQALGTARAAIAKAKGA